MKTTLKEVTIAIASILLISCAMPEFLHGQSPPVDTWTFPTNLDSWSFRNITNWPSDKGYAPISFTNITGTYRGDISTEYAPLVDTTNLTPARLQYNVVERTNGGATNLTLGMGAITFWFAPSSWASVSTNETGPGESAELLSVGQWTTNASVGYWGLAFDSGGTNLYFATQNSNAASVVHLSAPVGFGTNEWHFIALTYSATNSALYLDDKLATNGIGITALPRTNAITNGFFIGSDSTGFAQSRGVFDDIYTFGNPLTANDVDHIYNSQYYDFFLNPYNAGGYENPSPYSVGDHTNLWVNIVSITNNLATLLMANTKPDTLYEIQGKTNLSQTNWISEGFVYGSEITNWTAATVGAAPMGNLFLRTRSWLDSTGTGIPDWWWYQYFRQITNVDAYASAAGDGYSNFEKFQMGLNPTNYYNTNPPSGFFGTVAQATNVFLLWNRSPGPVVNYLVQRGILNTNTGNYSYTSFVLNSNATLFEDVGVVTNDNAQHNIYELEALYAGGCITGTNTWYVWQSGYASLGPPYGPPMASNVWANADATGTNLLISWSSAVGPATNYVVERGVYNQTNFDYDFSAISVASTNSNSIQILNEFTNAAHWNDIYAVVAAYANGVLSVPALSTIEAGPATGLAGPSNFSGYIDSTGTNVWLAWSLSTNATGYIIYRGVWNSDIGAYGYIRVASVGAGTNIFQSVGGGADGHFYDVYTVVAVYSGGVLSQAAVPWQVSIGSPAPGTFYAYIDSTGTNVILAWSTGANGTTGYILSRSVNSGDTFSQITQVSSNSVTYKDTNAVAAGVPSLVYEVQSTFSHGGVSSPSIATVSTTPPPPTGLSANVDSTGTNVLLSWQPAVGSVATYTIERGIFDPTTGTYTYTQIGTVSAGTLTFTDVGALSGTNAKNNVYRVKATTTGGEISAPDLSYLNSDSLPLPPTSNLNITAQLIRNGQGRWELMFSTIPTNVQAIAFRWYAYDYWYDIYFHPVQPYSAETDIPASEITNNIYVLSDFMVTNWFGNNFLGKVAMVQPVDRNGDYGKMIQAGFESYDSPVFVDARTHMKQNLLHELRVATLTQPNVSLLEWNIWSNPDWGGVDVSLMDTNYVESSFFHWSLMAKGYSYLGGNMNPEYLKMDNVWPITANYQLHHGLYDTNYTGPDFNWQPQGGIYTYLNSFQGPLTSNPAPPVLGIGDPYWMPQQIAITGGLGFDPVTGNPFYTPLSADVPDNPTYSASERLYFQSGQHNLFGLPFDTALVNTGFNTYDPNSGQPYWHPPTTLSPGNSIAISNINCFYGQTVDPGLRLTNYYFAPLITPGTALPGEPPLFEPYPIPTLAGFANTNQTGLMVASVGNPIVIGGWARFAITNADLTKFAYLGQYFTNAVAVTNGIVTTNTTGVLSPYGEFFPTEPGVVALVTMPDIDTAQRGTGIVRVVSLNVDANHDSTMDFSYNGPDFVSPSKPFRFWVNDNQDAGDYGGNSGIPGVTGYAADGQNWTSYDGNGHAVYQVHGTRDLTDFFPVCINISSLFQSNALSAGVALTDTNYQFVLSQADEAFRFAYTDLTPTNYMNFLRDTNEIGKLANALLTTVTSNGVVLPSTFLTSVATSNQNIIIVEASTKTAQPLVLTIYHGTNQIAQTQLPLSITGVEQMFRSKTILLRPLPGVVPDRLTDLDVPNEPDTIAKNFVFLHGYNVLPNEARGVASDTFKRLYWSGSHAKFWAVTWEGADTKGTPPFYNLLTPNYHTNVVNAFLIAPLLKGFISTLTNSGPVVASAHSLGNMVTLSAISDWNAPISQFFMLDAAVPIEALDPTVSTNIMAVNVWTNYSSRLYASDWWQLFPTNDARSQLTWSNRLGKLQNSSVYNCYSSGEEVLREDDADPPTDFSSVLATQLADSVIEGAPFGTYTWYWQEKGKGVSTQDWLIGSSHGGWLFSTYWEDTHGNLLSPSIMNDTTNTILQNQPMFNFNSTANTALRQIDNELLGLVPGVDPSAYAATNRNRILSDAIPAMSFVVGANPVPSFSPPESATQRNFNMMNFENGWPQGRLNSREKNNWHHSDFHEVAYTFTYQLFDKIVTVGTLK